MGSPVARFASVKLGTGVGLHYAESGDPAGDPVVCVHGWPDSWFSFSRVLPLLPGHLRALSFDQRGFGESDRPASGFSIRDFGADVVAFLDALRIPRATLIGHSFGSFVARQTAIVHPQRVAGLILIGTGFAAANPVTRELQQALRDLPDPISVEFARDFQQSTVHHPVPPEFFAQIVAESMKLPPRLWRLAVDGLIAYHDERDLARIDAPTLLLWGDHDALFSRADQDRVLAAVPGAQLKIYEDTGHCPNWERPELVAADIAQFVRSRVRPGSDGGPGLTWV